jgi:hypothetical protein
MSRHQAAPASAPKRTGRIHDAHDIRALTDTGAIHLPGRGTTGSDDASRSDGRRPEPHDA